MRRKLISGLLCIFVIFGFLYYIGNITQPNEFTQSTENTRAAENKTPLAEAPEDFKYKWLIEPKYEQAWLFSEDLWLVRKNEQWGYVDSADNVVIDFQYYFAMPFTNGTALVAVSLDLNLSRENEYVPRSDKLIKTIINKKGQYYIPPRSNSGLWSPTYDDKNIIIGFRSPEGKHGFLDFFGNIQIPAVYDKIITTSQGKALVRSGDLYGIVDTEGNCTLFPFNSENKLEFFIKGYIGFSSNGLWGLLNTKGEVVLEAKYSAIRPSHDDSGPIKVLLGDGKVGYLDETLNFVISPDRYQTYSKMPGIERYVGGIAYVYEAGVFKALDAKGETMFEFSSLLAEPYTFHNYNAEGHYAIQERLSGKLFLVNKRGEILLPSAFDSILSSKEGVIAVKQGYLWGLLLIEQ